MRFWQGQEHDGALPFVAGMVSGSDVEPGKPADTNLWSVFADWLEERGHELGPIMRALSAARWFCSATVAAPMRQPQAPWRVIVNRHVQKSSPTTTDGPSLGSLRFYRVQAFAQRDGLNAEAEYASCGPVADVLAPTALGVV